MDRLTSMEVFVAVVELGSLTAAAGKMGISAPMVGKHLRALEAHLGAAVLVRSTRRQSLSEIGRAYYERCKVILDEVRFADSVAAVLQQKPRGKLRISAPVSFGSLRFAPGLVDYMKNHPEVSIELVLNDRVVDLIEDGFDAAIRIGDLRDSGLVARPLASYAMMIAATPEYLARHGIPMTPVDLVQHNCLGFTHWHHRGGWKLGRNHTEDAQTPTCLFECSHGPALRMVALQSLGLVMQPKILLEDDVVAGRLVAVLDKYLPPPSPVHLVYQRDRQQLPKMKTLISFIVERFTGTL